MATTTTIRTLSADAAQQFPEIARRVLGNGGSTAVTPYASDGSIALWFVVESQADDGNNVSRMNYSGKLYASPLMTTAIGATVKARNTYEIKNTTGVRAGYTVSPNSTTCGDFTDIEPAPKLIPYPVLARVKVGSDWYYVFAHRNDPKVKLK